MTHKVKIYKGEIMKTIILVLTILISLSTNIFPQRERLERSVSEDKVLTDFYKPALMDSTQLDSILISTMTTYHIPGLGALINSKENGIIWKRNFGYANIHLNNPVEDTTVFLIASVSKTVVATAIMQFWEADSFDLDDNINDYLDDFQVRIPNFPYDTITFRMIMTHTSSIKDNWYWLNLLTICGDSPIPLDTFLINYFTPGGTYYNQYSNFVNAPPGTVWEYSNVAICILAYIVERFSGMPFDQYCKENIFDPLEMNKTSWFLDGLDTTTIATPYLWQSNQYIPYCQYGSPDYPDGQLRTTKMDLEHFLSAYMNWGIYNGARILDSSTVELILSDHLGYPIPVYGDYQGLVWYQSGELNNRWPWGHTGGWLGCRTAMFFQQNEKWGIICFMNSSPSYSTQLYILNVLCDYAQGIITEVEEMSNSITDFYLEQNYPNPFNPVTTIGFGLQNKSNVKITILNAIGEEVAIIMNEEREPGFHQVEFNATSLPSGVYFYQLRAGSFVQTKKMLLLK
jgi:CubicO group peptidase (beta-lactamase class C family)